MRAVQLCWLLAIPGCWCKQRKPARSPASVYAASCEQAPTHVREMRLVTAVVRSLGVSCMHQGIITVML